jgi:integrase/recombinase XerD
VTHLRQLMIEELRRRNFAESTIRAYVHGVEHFSQCFHRSPDQLGTEYIRQYQAMLFSNLRYSPNTVTALLASNFLPCTAASSTSTRPRDRK